VDGETYNNVKEIENGLGLPDNFLLSIYVDDDDRSFFIKLHSMMEAAVTHLLVTRFANDQLTDVLSSLLLGHGKTGIGIRCCARLAQRRKCLINNRPLGTSQSSYSWDQKLSLIFPILRWS
jgi:hypothetical protein